MLDEFSAAKISPSSNLQTKSYPGTSGPARPTSPKSPSTNPSSTDTKTSAVEPSDADDSNDFAEKLEADMADMMRELQSNPEFSQQLGAMMAQFGSDAPSSPPPDLSKPPTCTTASKSDSTSPKPNAPSSNGTPPKFQDTIRSNLERLQQSSATADAANTNSKDPEEDEIMSAFLAEMAKSNPGDPGASGNSEEGFSQMLLGMMEQLTNRDILYEPMKELDAKFPGWLAERTTGASIAAELSKVNGDKTVGQDKGRTESKWLSPEDRKRYEQQRDLVREIVARYERPGYEDDDPADREYIVERMQKMQAAGAPPPELVGDMGAASEFMGDLGEGGCPMQ